MDLSGSGAGSFALLSNNTMNDSAPEREFPIPTVGSYGAADAVLDCFLITSLVLSAVLALLVVKLVRGPRNLLGRFLLVEIILTLVASFLFIGQVLSSFASGNNHQIDVVACRFLAASMVSTLVILLTNVCILTFLRLVSILKPFYYEDKIAFSRSIAIVAAVIFVAFYIFIITGGAVLETDLRIYHGLCLVDFGSPSERATALFVAVFALIILFLLFAMNITLLVVSRRLDRKTAINTWDSTVNNLHSAFSGRASTSTTGGENTPNVLPISNGATGPHVMLLRRSISPYPEQNHGSRYDPQCSIKFSTEGFPLLGPAPLSLSDSNIASSLQTEEKIPMEELLDVQHDRNAEVTPLPAKTTEKLRVCFMRRCVSIDLGEMNDKPLPRIRRMTVISKAKFRLLQERFSASPITKLVIVISFLHSIQILPIMVFIWLATFGREVPESGLIWSMRFWFLSQIGSMFVYVLARRSYHHQVMRVLGPLLSILRRLVRRARGLKDSQSLAAGESGLLLRR